MTWMGADMKRSKFLAMAVPAVVAGCVGLGNQVATPNPAEGIQPDDGRRSNLRGAEIHRDFMKRARDRRRRRQAAARRRRRQAAARRRRRNS
jgi:hypothetical protein